MSTETHPPRKPPGPILISFVLTLATFALCLIMVFSGRSVIFGSQTVRFFDESGVSTALAQRAIETKSVERITPEQLREITTKILQRANEGDPRAALFAFEVERLQRAAQPKADTAAAAR